MPSAYTLNLGQVVLAQRLPDRARIHRDLLQTQPLRPGLADYRAHRAEFTNASSNRCDQDRRRPDPDDYHTVPLTAYGQKRLALHTDEDRPQSRV